MLFPIFETTREQFRDNLLTQLADKNCIIFFDTNLFSQLFKLYPGARREFYNWFGSENFKDRVKITNWSMQEYNNRAINDKLGDYLDGVQILNTVKKHLNNSVNFLQMFYDKEINKGSYSSKEDFMKDVKTVTETFSKITDSVKLHGNTVENLNSEFTVHLQKAVISSDIYSIVSNIQAEAEFRHQNNMPPGYKDDNKSSNKYGDLIIWKEILAYCKENQIKSLIFVSNDGKRDLVYQPFVPKPGGKKTKESDIIFPDPRLFDEFRTASAGEKFSIINFAGLISLLQENARSSFQEISTAIQLTERPKPQAVPMIPEENIGSSILENIGQTANTNSELESTEKSEAIGIEEKTVKDDGNAETQPTDEQPVTMEEGNEIGKTAVESQEFLLRPDLDYSHTALADGEFPNIDSGELESIIDELASFDWYRQNDAISQLWKINTSNLNKKDAIFVLGRLIYSAACGNAFEAIRYLESFDSEISKRNIFFIEHIVNGIFYEIYFDHQNQFRRNRFKDGFIDLVFPWQTHKDLKASIGFITKALDPFKDILLLIPSSTPRVLKVELKTEIKEEFPKVVEYKVIEITLGGRTITKQKTEEENPFAPFLEDNDFSQTSERVLLEKISHKTAVPIAQMNLMLPESLPAGKSPIFTLKFDIKIEL